MKYLAGLLVLLLAGCAASGIWLNQYKTNEQAQVDVYECRRDGEQYAANLGFNGNPLIVLDRYNQCMVVRGYVWTPNAPAK